MTRFDFATWNRSDRDPSVARLRCPHCRSIGTFDNHGSLLDLTSRKRIFGFRRCPNPECLKGIVAIFEVPEGRQNYQLVESLPPEVIDFDATDLPAAVVSSLEEAIQCLGAGCTRAAAIMVRRTLEEVCADKGATGPNLYARLKVLGTMSLMPDGLVTGLDSLRLLGNDAAHLEAQTYNEVGVAEVTLALDVAKEILKAVYQYGSIVARLNAHRQDQQGGA